MEKEEIQNNTSADQNEDTVKENEKPEENLGCLLYTSDAADE